MPLRGEESSRERGLGERRGKGKRKEGKGEGGGKREEGSVRRGGVTGLEKLGERGRGEGRPGRE